MSQTQIQIPLKDFIAFALGIEHDDAGNIIQHRHVKEHEFIPIDIANSIYAICENKHTAYIEFLPNSQPILWDFAQWQTDSKRASILKETSDKERIARFIAEANIKLFSKAFAKTLSVSIESAEIIASHLIKENNPEKLKASMLLLGLTKMITKKEEL